jgi:hypothetical protein
MVISVAYIYFQPPAFRYVILHASRKEFIMHAVRKLKILLLKNLFLSVSMQVWALTAPELQRSAINLAIANSLVIIYFSYFK